MKDLSEIRNEIDSIDSELIELLRRRMDCSRAVAEYKMQNGIPVFNRERENEILDSVQRRGGDYGSYLRLLFTNIMELSRAIQHGMMNSGGALRETIENAFSAPEAKGAKIAYQGIKGANSFEAAQRLFPEGELACYRSFGDVFDAVDRKEADFGVLPVENSTAGSVSAVYDLILQHRFYIIGALDLQIDHCLAALRQSELEDIDTVWSHPQALSQCAGYTAAHGFDTVSKANTAVAARDVARERRLNVAAICSRAAADEYGLKILEERLQDNPENTTRFIVISKKLFISPDANKISLCFSLPHVTGSLYNLLFRFNALGLNLTKIESRPIAGRDFDYLFYLDFAGSVRSDNVVSLLAQLSEEMPEFSFLGNYSEK